MAQPQLQYHDLRSGIDEVITADGDPYADAVAIIAHTLERALDEASGGMSESEFQDLVSVGLTLVGQDPGVRIEIPPRRKGE